MQQVHLSEAEQRVYQAVTTLEARGQVPYPDLIAEESGLPQEQLDTPLHLLSEKGLLHREDSPTGRSRLRSPVVRPPRLSWRKPPAQPRAGHGSPRPARPRGSVFGVCALDDRCGRKRGAR